MRTVQQYYDDNRDKILFDVRALEEYEKETIEASIHYYWEDIIKVLEDNKEEFEAKYSRIHQYIFFATLDRKVKK